MDELLEEGVAERPGAASSVEPPAAARADAARSNAGPKGALHGPPGPVGPRTSASDPVVDPAAGGRGRRKQDRLGRRPDTGPDAGRGRRPAAGPAVSPSTRSPRRAATSCSAIEGVAAGPRHGPLDEGRVGRDGPRAWATSSRTSVPAVEPRAGRSGRRARLRSSSARKPIAVVARVARLVRRGPSRSDQDRLVAQVADEVGRARARVEGSAQSEMLDRSSTQGRRRARAARMTPSAELEEADLGVGLVGSRAVIRGRSLPGVRGPRLGPCGRGPRGCGEHGSRAVRAEQVPGAPLGSTPASEVAERRDERGVREACRSRGRQGEPAASGLRPPAAL